MDSCNSTGYIIILEFYNPPENIMHVGKKISFYFYLVGIYILFSSYICILYMYTIN